MDHWEAAPVQRKGLWGLLLMPALNLLKRTEAVRVSGFAKGIGRLSGGPDLPRSAWLLVRRGTLSSKAVATVSFLSLGELPLANAMVAPDAAGERFPLTREGAPMKIRRL